jgi:hypothetical protein
MRLLRLRLVPMVYERIRIEVEPDGIYFLPAELQDGSTWFTCVLASVGAADPEDDRQPCYIYLDLQDEILSREGRLPSRPRGFSCWPMKPSQLRSLTSALVIPLTGCISI